MEGTSKSVVKVEGGISVSILELGLEEKLGVCQWEAGSAGGNRVMKTPGKLVE